MGIFKKKPTINVNKDDCCDNAPNGDGVINGLSFNPSTSDLTATTTNGDSFTTNLSALLDADGVVTGATYDDVTGVLTLTRSNGLPDVTVTITAPPTVIENTLFVMANGDDNTGTRERFDLPYASPWKAVEDAQAGDTVIVFPGTYAYSLSFNNKYLAKDQVTIYCHPGVTITTNVAGRHPFWDQGVAIEWSLLGYADLELYNIEENEFFMHANSTYRIECNNILKYGRWNSVAGARFDLLVRGVLECRRHQFFIWRNAAPQDTIFNLDVNEWRATDDIFGFNYNTWDIRNLTENAEINVKIKKLVHHHAGAGGMMQFVNDYSTKNIVVDNFIMDDNGEPPLQNYVIGAVNFGGRIDFELKNVNSIMNMARITGTATVPLVGKIKMTGKIEKPSYVGVPKVSGLEASSSCEFELDLQVTDIGAPGEHLINLDDMPEGCSIKGKIAYTGVDASNRVFQLNDTSTTTGYLQNLIIETDSTWLAGNAGTAQMNIPCMGVYSNTPLDPALHAAVIEPITVSPSVKV